MIELIKETKTWRVNDEEAAIEMINEYKDKAASVGYTITKSGYIIKTKKQKGEIVDMYVLVNITFSYEVQK